MARRRNKGRNVHGILVLDKPVGRSSNQALQAVKRLFNARKAGHTGNLDPMASGVLPLCLGEATKMSAFLLDADKRYRGTIKLGVRTDSGDAEGEVMETRPVEGVDAARVEAVVADFRGEISQVPPMHSAIKKDGQPLYKLARQGVEVEREARHVTIHALEVLRVDGDEIDIDVHCSKGTYIRTLAEDIGEALGCGGHLSRLVRTQAGPFTLEQAVSLEDLEARFEAGGPSSLDELLLPIEQALAQWPPISLTATSAHYVRMGQPVLVPNAPTSGWVRLFEPEEHFMGVGVVLDDGRVAPKRLLNVA